MCLEIEILEKLKLEYCNFWLKCRGGCVRRENGAVRVKSRNGAKGVAYSQI